MDIEILNENRLRYWCERIRLPAEAITELARIAALVRADKTLLGIFSEFHEKNAVQWKWNKDFDEFPIDPQVTEKVGESDTMFYLLAHLSALPFTEREYQRRGMDLAIFDATMSDIRTWVIHCREVFGRWFFNQLPWITLHLSCELFRLGRMQYRLGEFDGGVTALRSKASGEIVLLADPEVQLRADGYAYGAGDLPAAGEPWLPVFEENETGWRGNPVAPQGYAIPTVSLYPRAEWDLALKKGDTVLDMHIPRSDRFTMADCQDSLRQAFAFFPRYYPERPFTVGYCHTWFFSPQLQKIASPESNIVRFQREFYLYPFAGKLAFLWMYVFGEGVKDRASAPSRTTLQRAVLDWIDNGGEIFDLPGVMFHGPEEWGSQPYMSKT